eukprot:scaffold9021_cov118-Isochrysis_galbana.AAC.1
MSAAVLGFEPHQLPAAVSTLSVALLRSNENLRDSNALVGQLQVELDDLDTRCDALQRELADARNALVARSASSAGTDAASLSSSFTPLGRKINVLASPLTAQRFTNHPPTGSSRRMRGTLAGLVGGSGKSACSADPAVQEHEEETYGVRTTESHHNGQDVAAALAGVRRALSVAQAGREHAETARVAAEAKLEMERRALASLEEGLRRAQAAAAAAQREAAAAEARTSRLSAAAALAAEAEARAEAAEAAAEREAERGDRSAAAAAAAEAALAAYRAEAAGAERESSLRATQEA